MRKKSLLIPYDKHTKRIFLQDRRTYRKPDWGFFGGGIKEDESVMEALIRETQEELNITIIPEVVRLLGTYIADYGEVQAERNLFLYPTTETMYTVSEGEGIWVTFEQAKSLLDVAENFDSIIELINTVK